MKNYIDARGISAEKSWHMVKENISGLLGGRMTTVTDNPETAGYIRRMADKMGLKTQLEEMGGEYYLHFFNQTSRQESEKDTPPASNMLLIVAGESLGRGEESLGKTLMKGFFHNLKLVKPLPKCIIFINRGVMLTSETSDIIADLNALWERGVEILSESASLEFYNLKNMLSVGGVASMKTVVERITKSENAVWI